MDKFRTGKKSGIRRLRAAVEFVIIFSVDLVTLTAAFLLASYIRSIILPGLFDAYRIEYTQGSVADVWWFFLIWLSFIVFEGLYTKVFSFWDEIKAFWKITFYSLVSIFTLVSLGKLTDEVSRTVIVLMGFFSIFMLPTARFMCKKALRRLGFLRRNALILGAGDAGVMVLRALRAESNYGYRVLAFIDDDYEGRGPIEGLKVHKGINNIGRYIRVCQVQDIFIALPDEARERLKGMINTLQYEAERIFWVPGVSGIAVLGTRLQHFYHEQVLALEFRNNLDEMLNVVIKRAADIVASLVMLPFLLPAQILVAIAIKVESRGPAIFSHVRVGKGGRQFKCYKFRTMYQDAEGRLQDILEADMQARQEWERSRKIKDDARVTKVGMFLRKTSLDELPQIFNVLLGQMSLVGPRPVTVEELDKHYGDSAELYCRVLPGITGLWQVSGRSDTNYEYRVALDSWYIRNWNPWTDIIIILKTVMVVLKREGAW